MRHLTSILILALVAVAAVNASGHLNCSALPVPTHDFYNPSRDCANDTAIRVCETIYNACINTTTQCSGAFACVEIKLRCFETATPTTPACSTWLSMLSNEKLYLAAGGDYNGSTLELSCKHAVCSALSAKSSLNCPAPTYAGVCVDQTGEAPSSIPPSGVAVVELRIAGNKTLFDSLLSTEAGRVQARGIVSRLLSSILGIAAIKIIITALSTASLVVNFYINDPTISVASIQSSLETFRTSGNTALLQELATATGIPLADLVLGSVVVATAPPTMAPGSTPTPATPAPGAATPAPEDDSASLVATSLAVIVALLAMLL